MKKIFFLFVALLSFVACQDEGATLNRAGIISENFVKDRLKFPAEVEFNKDIRGQELSDTTFIVYQKFNAKNAFGVKVSYVYKAKMVFLGGDWADINNWSYNQLIIENVSTGEQSVFYSPNDK